jgi:hypothetical protein
MCVIEEDLFKNLQEFQILETSSRILSYNITRKKKRIKRMNAINKLTKRKQ